MNNLQYANEESPIMRQAALRKGRTAIRRWLAVLVDILLLAAFLFSALNVLGQNLFKLSLPVILLLMAAYIPFSEFRWGQSIGKRLLGLRVVRRDGARPTPLQASVRFLMLVLEGNLFLGIFSCVMTTHAKYGQRLGDHLARTYVIRARSAP